MIKFYAYASTRKTLKPEIYLNKAHVAVGNIHFAPEQTLRRVERRGVFWPTMRQDVYSYVRACTCGLGKEPTKTNVMTLI